MTASPSISSPPPNDNSLRQLRPPKDQEAHLPSPGVYAAIPRKTSEEAARVVAHLTLISGSFCFILLVHS